MRIKSACIVDDDEIYVFGLKIMMKSVNFCDEIMVCENGEVALNFLKPLTEKPENMPDVILLDINMPVMDGWQFLDEFTKVKSGNDGKTIIYMMSSSVNPADLEKAKTYELISDYLVKPVNKTILKEIVASLN